nr:radical SAM protein [Bacteroidales bacterium]
HCCDGILTVNDSRPLPDDLDLLPWPARKPLRDYAPGLKFATLLAGRGCVHKCSFCNLRDFYAPFRGAPRRNRKPESVVDEMDYLHRRENCSVFLFQDDDFPVGKRGSDGWILRFCDQLDRRKLSGRILWKINCRPDEVDENLFARMKETGLFLVFLGIEDGTNEGLKLMNKHLTIGDIARALAILKKLRIEFDYGFMLFTPSTTFKTLSVNLDFLDTICSHGYSPLSYLKMMPYYETQVEKDLRAGGRLKTDSGFSDYDFTDPRLNDYFRFISENFSEWIHAGNGLVNIAKWARNYLSVYSRFNMLNGTLPFLDSEFRATVSGANSFLTSMHRELALHFSQGGSLPGDRLSDYSKRIRLKHNKFRKQVNDVMFACMSLVSVSRAGLQGKAGAGSAF